MCCWLPPCQEGAAGCRSCLSSATCFHRSTLSSLFRYQKCSEKLSHFTDRVRVENFPRTHNAAVTSGNPWNDGGKKKFSLKSSKIESSPCRCTTTLLGDKTETKDFVCRILQMLLHSPKDFLKDDGHSLDRALKKNVTERTFTNQTVRGTMLMMINFGESGHLLFRGTSALFRGALTSKGGGRSSIH